MNSSSSDDNKTKQQLITELRDLRARLAEAGEPPTPAGIPLPGLGLGLELNVLRSFLDASDLGFGFVDITDQRILFANPAVARMMGHDNPEDLLGRNVADFYSSEDQALLLTEAVPHVLKHGQWSGELPLISDLGRVTEAVQNIFLVRDRQDKPRYLGNLIVDITRRKRMERELTKARDSLESKVAERTSELKHIAEQLAATKNQQAALLDSIPDMAWLKDLEGRYLAVNKAFCRMAGVEQDKVLGCVDEQIWPREMAERVTSDDRRLIDSGRVVQYTESFHDDRGNESWLEIVKVPILDAGLEVAGIAGVARDITHRKRMLLELEENVRRYRLLAENTHDIIWTIDRNLRPTYISPSIERLLGYTDQEALAMPMDQRFCPESMRQIRTQFQRLMNLEQEGKLKNRTTMLEIRERRKDGDYVWLEAVCSPLRDEAGTLNGFLGVSRDISQRKAAEQEMLRLNEELEQRVAQRTRELEAEVAMRKRSEQALRESEERYRTVADHTHDWECWVGPDGKPRYVSPSCRRITGYPPETFMRDFAVMETLINAEDLPAWRRYMDDPERMNQGSVDFRIHRRDGEVRWLCQVSRIVTDEAGRSLGVRTSLRDITERKCMEQQLRFDALHDPLTGLANRTLCLDRINQAMERSQRRDRYFFAVVFLDLDRFKMVNDSLGHAFGDLLLKEVSSRISACVRELDTVSRFGGDEFTLLLEELRSPREAIRTAKRMREEMRAPFRILGHEVAVSASFGIFLSPTLSERAEDLLQYANIAMHRAKDAGRNRIKVFTSRMLEQAVQQMTMENDLRRAVANQEFFIHFQPIVSLTDAKLKGFEALVRWRHPIRGELPPAQFIPMTEETGLIVELGQWVLATACKTMAAWRKILPQAGDLILSVNLSARQFSQPDLVESIRRTLRETGYPAELLRLEITETTIMENADVAADKLNKFRDLGIKLSIDDFGTGYSSMNYLHRFPLDTLKIDLSFVRRMHSSSEDMEIIKAIVNLAHNLGMEVVAEGVEEAAQLADLCGLECEYGQGYLFSRPVAPDAAERYIRGRSMPVAPEQESGGAPVEFTPAPDKDPDEPLN